MTRGQLTNSVTAGPDSVCVLVGSVVTNVTAVAEAPPGNYRIFKLVGSALITETELSGISEV